MLGLCCVGLEGWGLRGGGWGVGGGVQAIERRGVGCGVCTLEVEGV